MDEIAGVDLAQIGNRPIRLVPYELIELVPAGGHGQNLGSDGPRAPDIQRRVADNEHLVAPQLLFEDPAAAFASQGGEPVAFSSAQRSVHAGALKSNFLSVQFPRPMARSLSPIPMPRMAAVSTER
jgi:hypothetical protein